MANNRTKVESNAINVIRVIVDKSARLLPDPSFGDRGISTDGCIQLFRSEEIDKGENLLRQIPIQIKGRTDKSKKLVRINALKNKENVDVKDIQNYYRQGGVIFFFVYFDKKYNEHAVFYSVLMPVKCRRYLEIASNNKLKEVPVTFEKMEETGEKVFELCAQFHEEQNKQGFGGGTMMEHIVSWKDLNGETTLTTSAVGAKSPLDVLKRVVRGDIHFYVRDGSFNVPVEWIENSKILQIIHYDYPVMVNEEKLYDYIDVEIDVETKAQRLIFENVIYMDVNTAKITFVKENKSMNDLSKASKFLLALGKYKFFSAGEISLKLGGLNLDNINEEEFKGYIEIEEILGNIGLDSKVIIYNEANIELRKQLYLLWNIANHRNDKFFNDRFTLLDWGLCEKKYPLVIARNNDGEKNDIYSLLYTSKFQTLCESEDGEYYPVPTFAFPSYEAMRNLYLYDFDAFEEQVRRVPINEATREYVNIGALKLLSIYDVTGDRQIIVLVNKILESLSNVDDPYDNVTINKIQVKKRMEALGSSEIEILRNYSKCGKAILEFAANVLLDEKEKAMQKYQELREDEKKELEDTPLMTLYIRMETT